MRLTKAEREQVRTMFDGHCAYCGELLPARWHADHVEPVIRIDWAVPGKAPLRSENHRLDNIMPSCPPCNISKASMDLEVWRRRLVNHVGSLRRNSSTYRMAVKYGLIKETESQVVFYFEQLGAAQGEGDR